jgi:alkanesulfonate monooxygenase SsuD/methylene tetrahydromethanopterin reductase-like flavin-dependent oxidoreductase (luciferase family)
MEFGLFSNGFRPHTTAAKTYDEDIAEIVLADQLGFRDAYISEHHGEPPHIDAVDTIPVPELMMCKAAALTRHIRMGSAVQLIHLHHPVDVAVQAAVTSHMLGRGRYIFGFGTGFGNPNFSRSRGLSFEDRHARVRETLELVQKCWSTREPFDWDGQFWKGQGILALPKPIDGGAMAMATATETPEMIRLAAENGWIVLSAFIESAGKIRQKTELYSQFALAAGQVDPLRNVSVARAVYIADSRQDAIEDMRAAIATEVGIQAKRGFLQHIKARYGIDVPNDSTAIEHLVRAGLYIVGTPDEVTAQLKEFHAACGGFGTLLITAGKDWATHEKRARSMRLFMEQVAPRMRALETAMQIAAD